MIQPFSLTRIFKTLRFSPLSVLPFFMAMEWLGPATVEGEPLSIPGCTAYSLPVSRKIRFEPESGISGWKDPGTRILWYGKFTEAGEVSAKLRVQLPAGEVSRLELSTGGKGTTIAVQGTGEPALVDFGKLALASPGYHAFEVRNANPQGQDAGKILSLELDGPAVKGAHFNIDSRRNAASVHLVYPTAKEEPITAFYQEVTAVEDPVHTYYMACGFSRGYFGMQINSPVERRIIFSVWDAGSGQDAKDRTTVAAENHTALLAKGEGVHASVFGNEGTGGHSHLKYPWRTGEPQKFTVTAQPEGTTTIYTGYWFHPEDREWKLLARFQAPADGKYLRGLYSFSENFVGDTGHLLRKAQFGNQWVQLADGQWKELTECRFSHDGTGKSARMDRWMGVENGRFFLSHGGFQDGFTAAGTSFRRDPLGVPPDLKLPAVR